MIHEIGDRVEIQDNSNFGLDAISSDDLVGIIIDKHPDGTWKIESDSGKIYKFIKDSWLC